jgi:hypothetical protein
MENSTKGAGLSALETEVRTVLPTVEAARHLMRQEQTLRIWASRESGPLRPIRVGGRLGWKTAEILALLRGQK